MFKKSIICVLFLSFTLFFFSGIIVSAKENEGAMGFTIETMTPKTQINQDQSYFYIKTKPNEKQELNVKVKGTSKEPVKVKAFTTNGMTSELGTIDYIFNHKKDETLTHSIEEITQVSEPEFTIKQGEEKFVVITVNPPNDHYDGVKLGAVYFQQVDDTSENKETAIKTSKSYRVGLMLSESDSEYSDSKSLNLLEVDAELYRRQKSIRLTLQNPEPKMIAEFSMTVQIVNKENGKVVKTQKLEDGSIAPNSRFIFNVDWGIDPIPAGKYIAKVDANSRHESWKLKKDFEISEGQAKKMNDETLMKLTLPKWAYWATIGLSVLTIIVSVILIVRGKIWKSKSKKRKKKKRGKRR